MLIILFTWTYFGLIQIYCVWLWVFDKKNLQHVCFMQIRRHLNSPIGTKNIFKNFQARLNAVEVLRTLFGFDQFSGVIQQLKNILQYLTTPRKFGCESESHEKKRWSCDMHGFAFFVCVIQGTFPETIGKIELLVKDFIHPFSTRLKLSLSVSIRAIVCASLFLNIPF